MEVIKRNENLEEFNKDKIKSSIEKASKSLEGKTKEKIDEKKLKDIVDEIEEVVVAKKREKIQSEIIKKITFDKLGEKGFKDIAKEYEKNGLIEINKIYDGISYKTFTFKTFMYKVLNRKNETPKILSDKGSEFNVTINSTKDINEELVRKIEVGFDYNNTRALSDLFGYSIREDKAVVYNNIKKPYVAVGCLAEGTYSDEERYQVRILSNVIFKDNDRVYPKGGYGSEDASYTFLVGYCHPHKFNKKSILEITKNFYDRDHAKEFLEEELKKIKKGKLKKIYLIKTSFKMIIELIKYL